MTKQEAKMILELKDPESCKYYDEGKLCHLMNEFGICVYCGLTKLDIKHLVSLKEKAMKTISKRGDI